MQQEDQDHQCDRDPFFKQLFLQIFDSAFNQGRAVIDSDDFNTFRQAALKLCEFGLHAVNDGQCIFAVPHDYDPRDRLALTIEFYNAAAKGGAFNNARDCGQQDWGSIGGIENDLIKVGFLIHIAR